MLKQLSQATLNFKTHPKVKITRVKIKITAGDNMLLTSSPLLTLKKDTYSKNASEIVSHTVCINSLPFICLIKMGNKNFYANRNVSIYGGIMHFNCI